MTKGSLETAGTSGSPAASLSGLSTRPLPGVLTKSSKWGWQGLRLSGDRIGESGSQRLVGGGNTLGRPRILAVLALPLREPWRHNSVPQGQPTNLDFTSTCGFHIQSPLLPPPHVPKTLPRPDLQCPRVLPLLPFTPSPVLPSLWSSFIPAAGWPLVPKFPPGHLSIHSHSPSRLSSQPLTTITPLGPQPPTCYFLPAQSNSSAHRGAGSSFSPHHHIHFCLPGAPHCLG